MSEQSNNKPNNSTPPAQKQSSGPQATQHRRPHPNNNRRRHPNQASANNSSNKDGQKEIVKNGPQQSGQNPNNRRRPQHNNNNRPRPQNQNRPAGQNNNGSFSIERIYEKYLNLLDQHIIARRKYHDMFYRADPNQRIKLEKNFYNTLNDIREFENRLAPDVRSLFEKRNNGLAPDRIYTQNHSLSVEGEIVPNDLPPAEPHLLQSQILADYSNDTEESVGNADDYLRYKNLL